MFETMLAGMAESTAFVAMVGTSPLLVVAPLEGASGAVRLQFEGRAGTFVFLVHLPLFFDRPGEPETVATVISTSWKLEGALGRESLYAAKVAPTGNLGDIDGLVVAVEDFLAEFLADVSVPPVGRAWLGNG
jgi:hypothetical protein